MTDTAEKTLLRLYQEQLSYYRQAQRILDGADDRDPDGWAGKLDVLLNEVRARDTAAANDRAVWLQERHTPGPALRTLLDELATEIHTLAQRVDALLARLLERRQAIVPQLDLLFRQERMLKAYHRPR
jgi:hypothetical protein